MGARVANGAMTVAKNEAARFYSGSAEIRATVRSEISVTRHGIEPLREDPSLRCLGSCARKTETSPYVQRCHSTHSAGSDKTIKSTDACQSALECFSGIISRHAEIDKRSSA